MRNATRVSGPSKDKEMETREVISLRIKKCSLLLLDKEEIGVYVRTHYAAHEVINILVNELPEQNSELSIRLKEQGRKHVDIAATYGNLDNIHLGLRDLEKAKSYFDRALVVIHDMSEHAHVHVATAYNNLGDVHRELGHPKQARIFYNHALRIRLKQLGPDHIHIAATYGSLRNVSRQLGNLEQAKEYYDRALAI